MGETLRRKITSCFRRESDWSRYLSEASLGEVLPDLNHIYYTQVTTPPRRLIKETQVMAQASAQILTKKKTLCRLALGQNFGDNVG